jgi:DNA invertase Pin-like site-specific DNA recombinase
MVKTKGSKKNLTEEQRNSAVSMLLNAVGENGKFPHGAIKKVAQHFLCDRSTMFRLWNKAESARKHALIIPSEFCSKKNETGRRPIYSRDELKQEIASTPLFHRRSERGLASYLGVSKSLVQSCMNEIVKNHGNNDYAIPHLQKEKLERIGQLPTALPVTEIMDEYENINDNNDNNDDGSDTDSSSEDEEEMQIEQV